MNGMIDIPTPEEFTAYVEKLYEDTKGGDRIYMTRVQWNWFASQIVKHTTEYPNLLADIALLKQENSNLQDQIKAYKLAIERGKGNDCPPDGDALSACPIDTDKDCTACWAEYLLGQLGVDK